MNPILWMVFSACLAYQANADYWVEINTVTSFSDGITVTYNETGEGDIKITNHEEREGSSTFKATIVQGYLLPQAELEGELCDVNDETPEGWIAKIIHMAVEVDDCPFPEGDLPITKEFDIEGNLFDKYITPGFGYLTIKVQVYLQDNDGSDYDVIWFISMGQYKEDEPDNGGGNENENQEEGEGENEEKNEEGEK